MGKTLLAACLASLFLFATLAATTGPAQGVGWTQDLSRFDVAFGLGIYGPGCLVGENPPPLCGPARSFTINATTNGRLTTGWHERGNPATGETLVGGPVTCMQIEGNKASIGGIVTASSGSYGQVIGDPYLTWVTDNGVALDPPRDGVGPIGFLEFGNLPDGIPTSFPYECPSAVSSFGYIPVSEGNIVIREGTMCFTRGASRCRT